MASYNKRVVQDGSRPWPKLQPLRPCERQRSHVGAFGFIPAPAMKKAMKAVAAAHAPAMKAMKAMKAVAAAHAPAKKVVKTAVVALRKVKGSAQGELRRQAKKAKKACKKVLELLEDA